MIIIIIISIIVIIVVVIESVIAGRASHTKTFPYSDH